MPTSHYARRNSPQRRAAWHLFLQASAPGPVAMCVRACVRAQVNMQENGKRSTDKSLPPRCVELGARRSWNRVWPNGAVRQACLGEVCVYARARACVHACMRAPFTSSSSLPRAILLSCPSAPSIPPAHSLTSPLNPCRILIMMSGISTKGSAIPPTCLAPPSPAYIPLPSPPTNPISLETAALTPPPTSAPPSRPSAPLAEPHPCHPTPQVQPSAAPTFTPPASSRTGTSGASLHTFSEAAAAATVWLSPPSLASLCP